MGPDEKRARSSVEYRASITGRWWKVDGGKATRRWVKKLTQRLLRRAHKDSDRRRDE